MTRSKIVDINISNVSKEAFEVLLAELTTMIANLYFDTQFTAMNIYKHVEFKDYDNTNLDVNTSVLDH